MRRAQTLVSPGGALACVLLTAVITVADLAHGLDKTQYVGLMAAIPFLAATFAAPWGVVALGGLALSAGAFIGVVSDDGSTMPQYVRLACIVLATALAALAAHRRLRRESRLIAVQSAADAASRAILRPLPPTLGGVAVSVDYLSAFEAARVGGDLYEAVETPYGLRLAIGDVRGKGLEAVRLAALTLGSFREAAQRERDLQQVALLMHAAVTRDAGPEDFVTALLVQVQPDRVCMLSCGHPAPLLVRDGRAEELALPEEPPLGIGPPGSAVAVDLLPGDRVLLYTDGAVEARREGRFFALPPAAAAALGNGDLSAALAQLSRQVRAFTGGGPSDDVAFLAFEVPSQRSHVPAPR